MRRFRVAVAPRTLNLVAVGKFAGLLALALLIPMFGLDQRFTGPLVNALLLISTITVGVPGAIMVGALPSVVSLARGTLPLPMAAMVPYIIVGNAALILVFATLRPRGYWLAVGVGAVIKFGLLLTAVNYLVAVPPSLAVMMQWPQLYTAVLGGVIAWGIIRFSRLWRQRTHTG